MRRQSAWVLVVFGWSRDLHAVCVDCSGVGRVQCVQQRPLGGCGSRPIRHSDGVGGWYRLTEPSHSCWEGQPTGQGVGKSEINPRGAQVIGIGELDAGGQAGGHDVTIAAQSAVWAVVAALGKCLGYPLAARPGGSEPVSSGTQTSTSPQWEVQL